MKKFLSVLILTAFFIQGQALAHGENKPGPHGGFIRMPGVFHTEVVPTGANSFNVYLLDMAWRNPSTKKSKVVAHLKETKTNCSIEADHFVCQLDKNADLKETGTLTIEAMREEKIGKPAIYPLPLKLGAMSGHGGHP